MTGTAPFLGVDRVVDHPLAPVEIHAVVVPRHESEESLSLESLLMNQDTTLLRRAAPWHDVNVPLREWRREAAGDIVRLLRAAELSGVPLP
jgi:hypothetical protein